MKIGCEVLKDASVHRPKCGVRPLLEPVGECPQAAPQVISNAIFGVIDPHRTAAMNRGVMRNCDKPASRQPLASQQAS